MNRHDLKHIIIKWYNQVLTLSLFVLFLNPIPLKSQSEPTFYLGHSLVNFNIPHMVSELAISANNPMRYNANIGNGANLGWHWTHPETGQGDRWDQFLNTNVYKNFVLTEAIPLKPNIEWSNTYGYLDSFYRFATPLSPDITLYIYETWHCNTSGTPDGCEWDNESNIPWRTRLSQDFSLWESIADEHNRKYGQKAYIIPGGQGMARLYDTIAAGKFVGYDSFLQLFTDNIHLNLIGNYFMACIMYAVIFKSSPEGLEHQLMDMYGQPYTLTPTLDQAKILQKIAWETACDHGERTNVNCNLNVKQITHQKNIFYYSYPTLFLKDAVDHQVTIFNSMGQMMANTKTSGSWNLSFLSPGIYFALLDETTSLKFIVK